MKLDSSCSVDFYEISGREDGISLSVKMINLANELADKFNPMDDIFHLMCHQFPEHLIQRTLEDNGYYFSTLESSQIYFHLDDETEVVQFLKTCESKNIQLLPIRESKNYDPNEIVHEKELDNLLDVELLNLSVIDFVREDFRLFKRKHWRRKG
ncbi:hypothetical protein HLH17_02250 [Acinetobacter sp. ANC 5380]|uniref:Uncharacterized protein n=1 Tax=Acinetobacter terrae TaxID=2731247 RepID=A0A7Y2RD75_9GAMM|nr:hypothetical protein [Acinetobacter terrae]NNH76523.1 hypothetical protein [Acinetobacter terrae]